MIAMLIRSRIVTVCLFVALFLVLSSVQVLQAKTLLVWGDSLSAAYNIPVERGWVSLLGKKLKVDDDPGWVVRNGSVSGETSGGGLTRLPDALAQGPVDVFVLALGSNDGLRGLSLKELKRNLNGMLDLAVAQGAKVLLLGNMIPPNYGVVYADGFAGVYTQIAAERGIPLLPFFLEGVATNFDLIQNDGLHPTAEAQPKLLENVWPYLETLL